MKKIFAAFGWTDDFETDGLGTGGCKKIARENGCVKVTDFSAEEFHAIASREPEKILAEPVVFDSEFARSHALFDGATPMVVDDGNGGREVVGATWQSLYAEIKPGENSMKFARKTNDLKGYGVYELTRRNQLEIFNSPAEAIAALRKK